MQTVGIGSIIFLSLTDCFGLPETYSSLETLQASLTMTGSLLVSSYVTTKHREPKTRNVSSFHGLLPLSRLAITIL